MAIKTPSSVHDLGKILKLVMKQKRVELTAESGQRLGSSDVAEKLVPQRPEKPDHQ
jgi:hypothetical protein